MKTVKLGRVVTSVGALVVASLAGCSGKPASTAAKPVSPASVAKLPGEADLVVITLKPEAEVRLKILTAPVARKPAPRALTMGGDVIVPPGKSSMVTAPQTGTLVAAEGLGSATPGRAVKKGQTIFTLLPLLSADRMVLSPLEQINFEDARNTAEGQYKTAKPQFDQAKINLDRMEKLAQKGDVTQAQLIDARNAYTGAKATFEAAEGRWSIFQKSLGAGAENAGKLAPLPLRAPADGVLINVGVQAGQPVTSGSILFEVANLDPVYIRVPVFVAEEETIDIEHDAAVGGVADAPGRPTRPAKPVLTTPSANSLANTIDLYYEVENHDGRLRPGQRVGVTLPLKGETDSLVVPYASVLYDHNGGGWVYESMGKHAYARRRVVVDHVVGPEAVLTMGPKPGTLVVTDGAAELFGTEFAGSK